VAVILPSPADKAKLITLGSDIFNAWYAGTPGATEEYFNSATRIWSWNASEAGNDNDFDIRLGLSSLCAALYRFKKPRSVADRELWRRLAVETVDQWFTNQQDLATGGIWRTSLANLAGDSGTCTFFGLQQLAIIIKCLGPAYRTRWADQIADALDYTTGRGELTYYTNGNIMFLKLISYELGAYVTGDQARRDAVEDLWEFTVDPEAFRLAQGAANQWRGCGFHDEGDGVGYFSETSSTGAGTDHSASNVLDWIYTDAQANYAACGYLLFGDPRYATYANACTRKMMERWNFTTNQFDFSGGSRNAGPGVRNCTGLSLFTGGWIDGISEFEAVSSSVINNGTQGLDVDFRRYLAVSHSTFVRGFGTAVATGIIAAHGATLS
jgi:hypothetical protein